jgi:hypothetical protein
LDFAADTPGVSHSRRLLAKHRHAGVTHRELERLERAQPRLIDTRLVRVELARLRGPHPTTISHRARAKHATSSAERG